MPDREEEHRRRRDGELPAFHSERGDPVAEQREEERRHAEGRQVNEHDPHRGEEREVPGSIERRGRERGGLLAGQRREEGGHGSMLRADHEHVCEHRARERERQDEPEDDLHLSDAEVEAVKEERAAEPDRDERRDGIDADRATEEPTAQIFPRSGRAGIALFGYRLEHAVQFVVGVATERSASHRTIPNAAESSYFCHARHDA